jgi:D-alanyl-D-alanine carboxypeptidase (penicillin-binding protein 5/6)
MIIKFFRENIGRVLAVLLGLLLVGGVVFLVVTLNKDIKIDDGEVTYHRQTEVLKFDVPTNGEVAVGTLKHGVKAVYGGDSPRPIASLAKTITALVVLDEKPSLGDEIFTISARDVEKYSREVVRSGSRLYVIEGEQLTGRQAIEALMLVSANNIADSLVRWVFGDFDSYKTAAEQWLAKNGLKNTAIGPDASGYDPATVSTPSDMIEIGRLALNNALLREITLEQSATFPLAGEEANTNRLLADGFVGIKTGNSDQALSCLLFARQYGDDVFIGAMLGQPFNSTFESARKIWASLDQNFTEIKIPMNTIVGKYNLPWGGEVDAVTTEELTAVAWRDAQPAISLDPIGLDTNYKSRIGHISLGDQTVGLRINSVLSPPSLLWRLQNLTFSWR